VHYTITLENTIKALKSLIFIFCGCIGLFIYHENIDNGHGNPLKFFSYSFIICAMPCVYLHLQYYKYNKGRAMDIFPEKGYFIWTSQTGPRTIEFSEIEKIVIYRTPSGFRKNSVRYLPFEGYHYAIIHLKSKDEIIFTSLMAPIVEDAVGYINGVEIEFKKRFFANIARR
jgi:hypothetical protein